MSVAYVDAEGRILRVVLKPSPFNKLRPGERLLHYNPPECDDLTQEVNPVQPVDPEATEIAFEITDRPDALARAKARKNLEINASRAAVNQAYFVFQGKQIAVDPLSRSDIDAAHGAILMLQAMPPGWPGAWKAMDNTYVSIPDVATWAQFYGTMVATGTANFAHSQLLKAALAAAQTLDDVSEIPAW